MIDVYHANGKIEWDRVKAQGHRAVYIKLTEGDSFLDPMSGVYTHGALQSGFLVGFYHFWQVEAPVRDQLQHFLKALYQVGWNPKDFLPPALDFEDQAVSRYHANWARARLHAFLHNVEDHVGVRPVIYGSKDYLDTYIGDGYEGHPLWIAHYTSAPTPEPLPNAWGTWAIWQYEPNGHVDGIETPPVDLNRVNLLHPLWKPFLKEIQISPQTPQTQGENKTCQ